MWYHSVTLRGVVILTQTNTYVFNLLNRLTIWTCSYIYIVTYGWWQIGVDFNLDKTFHKKGRNSVWLWNGQILPMPCLRPSNKLVLLQNLTIQPKLYFTLWICLVWNIILISYHWICIMLGSLDWISRHNPI